MIEQVAELVLIKKRGLGSKGDLKGRPFSLSLGPFFVYPFAIIDVYSRKIVSWHLSMDATVSAMKRACHKPLLGEASVEKWDAPSLPGAFSDHGVQMMKKTAKKCF